MCCLDVLAVPHHGLLLDVGMHEDANPAYRPTMEDAHVRTAWHAWDDVCCVVCRVSCVACRMSRVMCHVCHVASHVDAMRCHVACHAMMSHATTYVMHMSMYR